PQLRRGDEVAGRAELGRAGAVVAQAGRVQAQLHEARERDRAAGGASGLGDFVADQLAQALAMGERRVVGWGQCGHAPSIAGAASTQAGQTLRWNASRSSVPSKPDGASPWTA